MSGAKPTSGPAPAAARPRYVVIAILLNFFGGGAGYLYLGRPWRALLLAVWSLATVALWFTPLGGILATPAGLLTALGVALVVLVAMIVDTASIARREVAYIPRWYNNVGVYAGAVVASFLAGSADLLAGNTFRPALRAFDIPSQSMEPNLRLGERFLADMGAFRAGGEPRRGDIVVFRHPRQPDTIFVKRIIGLPGERVRLAGGIVHIDGVAVATTDAGAVQLDTGRAGGPPGRTVTVRQRREALPGGPAIIVYDGNPKGPLDDTAEVAIPAGQWLVLGDNRDDSVDSRTSVERGGIGLVTRELLEGRASLIYWSREAGRIGSRL